MRLLVTMWFILVLCPVFLAAVQTLTIDSQLGTSIEDCFERISIGEQLPADAIYRNVSELTTRECEQICKQDKQCQTYDYGVGAKGNATCNLSNLGEKELKEKSLLKRHPDYDVYVRRFQCEQSPPTPIQAQFDEPGDGPQHRPVFRPDDDEPKNPLSDEYLTDPRPYSSNRPPYRPANNQYNQIDDRPDDYSSSKPHFDRPPSYGDHRPPDIPYVPPKPTKKPDPYDVLQFQEQHKPNRPYDHGNWRPDPHYPPHPDDDLPDLYGQRPIKPRPELIDPYRPEKPDYHYIFRPNRKPRPTDDTGYGVKPFRPQEYPTRPDPYGQGDIGHPSSPIGPPDIPYRPSRPSYHPSRPYDPTYSYNSQYASNYGQTNQDNSIYVEIYDPPRPYKPYKPLKPDYGLPQASYGQNYGYGQGSYGYGSSHSQNSYSQSQSQSQYFGTGTITEIDNYDPYRPDSGYKPPYKPPKPAYDSQKPGYGNQRPSDDRPNYGSFDQGYGNKPSYGLQKPANDQKPSYGGSQGSYGGSQASHDSHQGSYGISQSSQASYGSNQASYSSTQGSYGASQGYGGSVSQNRPYGPSQDSSPGYGPQTTSKPSGGYNKPTNDKPSYGQGDYNSQDTSSGNYGSGGSYGFSKPPYTSSSPSYGSNKPSYDSKPPYKPSYDSGESYSGNKPDYESGGSYGGNKPSYDSSSGSYGSNKPSFDSNSGSYGSKPSYDTSSGYGGNKPSFDSGGGSYGSNKPSYDSGSSYGGSKPSFDNTGGSYGANKPSFDNTGGSYGGNKPSNTGYGISNSPSYGGSKPSYDNYGNRPPYNDRPNQGTYGSKPSYQESFSQSYGSSQSQSQFDSHHISQSFGYGKPDYSNRPDRPYNDEVPIDTPSYNQPNEDTKNQGYKPASRPNQTGYDRPHIKPVYEYEFQKPANVPSYIVRPGGDVITSRPVTIGDYGEREFARPISYKG